MVAIVDRYTDWADWADQTAERSPCQRSGAASADGDHNLAKVRVAGSNPVVRSKYALVSRHFLGTASDSQSHLTIPSRCDGPVAYGRRGALPRGSRLLAIAGRLPDGLGGAIRRADCQGRGAGEKELSSNRRSTGRHARRAAESAATEGLLAMIDGTTPPIASPMR